jgi:hypothetical protein
MNVPDTYIEIYLTTKRGVETYNNPQLVRVSTRGDTITYLYAGTIGFTTRILPDPTSNSTYTYVFATALT